VKFHVHWQRDDRTPSPRPSPIRATTKAEARAIFRRRWPQTKIIKITIAK
jgi:hypothetical protein